MQLWINLNADNVAIDRSGSLALLGVFLIIALVACGEAPRSIPLLSPNGPASGMRHGPGPARGLEVLVRNPRYFTDAGGQHAVYLTGSHTWNNFQDWALTDSSRPFDYAAYLDFLERYGHNFIRLYVWEQAAWFPGTEEKVVITPLPYLRTGPVRALDGGLRFDLTRFNPGYFRRLRERVEAAGARGIYVSVMLFNGWSIELKGNKSGNPWRGHLFNRENNINGIDGDIDGDGEGKEVHALLNPAVTSLQKTYLRKIVETLGDLDNVLWEISNESHPGAVEWQYEMIRTIKDLESNTGKRHPVGMTSMWPHGKEGNASLFESPAEWISPHKNATEPYGDNPPASTGRKIILSDTDHIWGIGGDARWVWMSFLRGLNPIFMDPYEMAMRDNYPLWPSSEANGASTSSPAPEWEGVRKAMGYARALADRIELASMRPMGELASTGYCLATPGKEYLVYLPSQDGRLSHLIGSILKGLAGEHVEVDLSPTQGTLDVEWVDVERGQIFPGDPVRGGQRLGFHAPFAGDAVLHLRARDGSSGPEEQPRAGRDITLSQQ